MPDEVLLGSIELSTLHSIRWVRVTTLQGWAVVLRRVLRESANDPNDQLVKVYVAEQNHFTEILRFHIP